MASEAGQLQLNAFEPIIGWSLHKSVRHLRQACVTLRQHCVAGIRANRDLLARRVAESVTLVTALNPLIGYEKAALLAKTALAHGTTIADAARSLGVMNCVEMRSLLVPQRLTQPVFLGGRTVEGCPPGALAILHARRRENSEHAAQPTQGSAGPGAV
jgi:aspartate ammonia-lyase